MHDVQLLLPHKVYSLRHRGNLLRHCHWQRHSCTSGKDPPVMTMQPTKSIHKQVQSIVFPDCAFTYKFLRDAHERYGLLVSIYRKACAIHIGLVHVQLLLMHHSQSRLHRRINSRL